MKHSFYIGTYTTLDNPTTGRSKGIYVVEMDHKDGHLENLQAAAEIVSPSFLQLGSDGRHLYCVCETAPQGAVGVFARDPQSGQLTHQQTCSSHGSNPCHLELDAGNTRLMVANYSSGSIVSIPVLDDGRLGEESQVIRHTGSGTDPVRQEGSHAHSVWCSPDNRFVYALDLGLDKIFAYPLPADARELPAADAAVIKTNPGLGPRHLAWHPNGQLAFVICEMGNCIHSYRYEADHGNLLLLDRVSSLPPQTKVDNITADIHVHPNGRFVYGSNRGHDSLFCCAVDAESGRLTPLAHEPTGGEHPRNFCIHPDGRFLHVANQNSNNLVCFEINPDNGQLTRQSELPCPAPVCLCPVI